MKKKIFILLLLSTAILSRAQEPEWVRVHPVSDREYIGVGMASESQADYMRQATQEALSDIASQISMQIESNSFLHQIDVDGMARELFEDKIEGSIKAWIEGQELVGTYSSNGTYYVCYSLDKGVYARNAEKRRKQAVTTGLDYLDKGREAESAMDLSGAVKLYAKGLEAVEPWLFMDLTTASGVNVPVELYSALINVFGGMAITVSTYNLTGQQFNAVSEPVAACLSKNGYVVPNVRLKAEFVTGSGTVTPAIETDYNGTAEFYITNVTSKDIVQEIRITVDDSVWEDLPEAYVTLIGENKLPSAKVTLTLERGPVTAYLHMGENDLEGCERGIRSLLANNHFSLTEDPDAAECFIDFSTVIEMGGTVSGGTYDLNVCYCSLELKIFDNASQELLLDYSADRIKVLAPIDKSVDGTLAMCVREVMKRVNRELPSILGKMTIR